ncbi:Transcription initiation factor IIA large subunit [Lachnellula suecica]|uniref:Transcription initiation factor IIA large subunit n=1 Tax=Lachnellula suecica TaxID=602035 RepID=A0A8T9BXH0_9HELO|nr:Transcription initiation factor IIA large subunit [Lachnellula suecica]
MNNAPPQNAQNQPGMQQMPMPMPMPQMNNNGNAPRIKPEPGMESPPMSQPPYHTGLTMPNATTAQQRAVSHLQNNYGQRAAASINAIQGSAQPPQNPNPNMAQQMQHQQMAMHQQQQRQMQQQMQQQHPQQGGQQKPKMTQEQYQRAMAAQAAQARGQIQQNNGFNAAQTDGAGDDMSDSSTVIKKIGANGEEVMGRIEIDGLIRSKIEAMGQSMEGGGLMLPLQQLKKSQASKRQRKVKTSSASGIPQADGGDSDDEVKDEELDEDAINSDLDDPDDGLNDEEDEDEGMGHIMLCMYDKVQRVKNKCRRRRKCVMKDGVLTVNGKEYVFHKAQGEYEW